MKRFFITSILAVLLAAGTSLMAQERPDDYLGLPGDNLNLYAVMKLFQESETLEGFERSLNNENSRINNLDLNGDNLIDYIKVSDYVDGDVHTIVLSAMLDKNESQDVAVFTVQKLRSGSVQIQLIGDEALYGKNYIIEPIFDETPNPGYTGNARRVNSNVVRTTTYEIAAWPVVRYIYMPGYNVWRSSWYWGFYPDYWSPWHPYYWDYYYGYHYHWYSDYYRHYRRYDHYRYDRWNDFYYTGKRNYSSRVTVNINEGRYKTTYSHPEQRRDGEALYAKVHPERASQMTDRNANGRRAGSQTQGNARPEGTNAGNSRRSNGTMNNAGGTTKNGNANGNARRSTGNTNKAGNGNAAGQNNGATPRSTTTVNNRANTNSQAGQSTVTNRRSTETKTAKPAAKPEPVQRSEPARTTKPQTTGTSSSSRRSTESKPAESKTKTNSTAKPAESTTTRRP